jgi:hypothetical protein
MNWAWANSLDQIWRSPAFPMWLTLAAAGFFGVIVLITLLRAEKSVANGALTVITLLAVGVAVAATMPGFGLSVSGIGAESRPQPPMISNLAPLSCMDDLAGETVLTACEKALFGSAEMAAAAASYAALQITRLAAFGDVTAANKNMTPELQALRHAVEHDRYGLIAHVLTVRDHCTPSDCAAFRTLTDRNQIVTNIEERVYDGLISRYAPTWNAPASVPVAALVPGVPTGRPTNAEFPSASSTPPVSIMTAEPTGPTSSVPRAATPAANSPATAPSTRPSPATSPALAAAKKPPNPKPARTPAPAASPASVAPAAPVPAASNQ